MPNNEHKSVAVDSTSKTAARSAVAGKTVRRTVMACARAPRIRVHIPVLGTTASRCQASTLGPGEYKSTNFSSNQSFSYATEKKRKLHEAIL